MKNESWMIKVMKITVVKWVCALLILSFYGWNNIFAQTTREEMYETPEKTGGVYYAYPYEYEPQTPAPKGYKPFYISHYGRHGSRWLISDNDYKEVVNVFEDAYKANALTELGKNVHDRLVIVWEDAQGRGGDLTPLGVRQHRGIAERMFHSFPEVFEGEPEISSRSTVVIRCVLSMDAFCERLKELNPGLKITREASNKYMNYLNYHTQASMDFTSEKGPWREEYRKFEETHIRPQRLISTLFSDAEYVKKKVNPGKLMMGLYWIASDMQNTELTISFYDIFEKEELFDLWQCINYRFYVCDGPSAQNNGLMPANAKPLLRNILDSANEVIKSGTNSATLRFGHDGNVIPLVALMKFENCYAEESAPDKFYKVWSDFKIVPMAGNVQIIFFRKKGSDDILVKFLHNERETRIPVKSDIEPYYHWKDVESYYRSLLD